MIAIKKPVLKKTALHSVIIRDRSAHAFVKVLRILLVIGLSYLFLFPIIYMVGVAFQSPESVSDPTIIWIPKQFTLDSIKSAIKYLDFFNSLALSLRISIPSTLFTMISCSMVGYGFARFDFKGKKLVFFLVLLVIIVPPQTIMMSSYLNYRFFDFGGILKIFGFKGINLLNTEWTFILPSMFAAGLRSGLFIFIFKQFFGGLPKDFEEAAKIDGYGPFATFVKVMVPLAVPAFITVMLFSFVWHWNDLYSSDMYFTIGTKPLTPMLSGLSTLLKLENVTDGTASPYMLRTYMAAGALLTIILPLTIYIFAQKYFTESIENTGIVG